MINQHLNTRPPSPFPPALPQEDQPWGEALPYLADDATLEIDLVGPNLSSDTKLTLARDRCGRRAVVLRRVPALLQEVGGSALARGYDLVVALNPGLVFYPSWRPALAIIERVCHDGGCAFVTTAWSAAEALAARQLLLDAGFDTPRVAPNSFASRAPQRVTDDHGTTCFGNLVLVSASVRRRRTWAPLLRPPRRNAAGAPDDDTRRDARAALVLIHVALEITVGVDAPPDDILDDPRGYRRRLRTAAQRHHRPVPDDMDRDMREAHGRLLGAREGLCKKRRRR